MTERFATGKSPYHFTDSGLDYVYLSGIAYFKCRNGHRLADIPAVEQLMELIARDVVEKPAALTGPEIKFLRKRLSKKAVDFAKEIGLEPETLSRIENSKRQAKESTDKLIRLYYAVSSGDPVLLKELQTALVDLLTRWTETQSKKKLMAKVTDNAWETEAVA